MARTTTYEWKPYSDGGLANPEGQMTAYITDPNHNPQQWQEDLTGTAKDAAIAIVEVDRSVDEPIDNFKESVISTTERIVRRRSDRTGNAWELALDKDGWGLPDPFTGYVPGGGPWPVPQVPAPEIPVTSLTNATVKIEKPTPKTLRITIEGNLPEA
jgi:hypothetical protein